MHLHLHLLLVNLMFTILVLTFQTQTFQLKIGEQTVNRKSMSDKYAKLYSFGQPKTFSKSEKSSLKYYSPTVTHGKTLVYDFRVL